MTRTNERREGRYSRRRELTDWAVGSGLSLSRVARQPAAPIDTAGSGEASRRREYAFPIGGFIVARKGVSPVPKVSEAAETHPLLITMLRITMATVLATAPFGQAFHMPLASRPAVAPFGRLHAARVAAPLMGDNPLTDAMEAVADFISKATGAPKASPTADEIENYCRDPDSSGCDLDMVDKLMAEAAELRERQSKVDKARAALGDLAAGPIRWHNEGACAEHTPAVGWVYYERVSSGAL